MRDAPLLFDGGVHFLFFFSFLPLADALPFLPAPPPARALPCRYPLDPAATDALAQRCVTAPSDRDMHDLSLPAQPDRLEVGLGLIAQMVAAGLSPRIVRQHRPWFGPFPVDFPGDLRVLVAVFDIDDQCHVAFCLEPLGF